MNRGPELLGPPSSGATNILGKTLRTIIKIVATRRRILRLKCTKFDFGWGSPQTPPGAYSAPQTPASRQGRGWAGEEEEKGRGREGGGSGGERKGGPPSYC